MIRHTTLVPLLSALSCLASIAGSDSAMPDVLQGQIGSGGTNVIPAEALLTTAVGGLERTGAKSEIVSVKGRTFANELRVTITKTAPETNATQLTIPIATAVSKGDALLATFFVRGQSADGKNPAHVELLFERTVDPWTKSVEQGANASKIPGEWRRVVIPFAAAESYRAGEAMVSLRFAFGPQSVEVGGLGVVDLGHTRSLEELTAFAADANPLGEVGVAVHLTDTKQTMVGFGGDFCAPRYGYQQMTDPVGRYNLEHLHIAHARVGLPLNWWTPQKGAYKDEGPAHAALLMMQDLAGRHIPITCSVWEGPEWMLGGKAEQSGRVLPPERYGDAIEAIGRFLVTARDQYHAEAETFSFNEADYGVNFRFTSATIADFIRQAGPRFHELGLKTTFLIGDTSGGSAFPDYVRPLLADKSIAPYLGPLAFHCWDALGAPDYRYAEIAQLGKQSGKPVWCTEAGWDSGLWQRPNPWGSWDNGLQTALAYEKTLRLTAASVMDYWTYENDYPLVTADGRSPYPVWSVIKEMEDSLPSGSKIATATSDNDDLRALASVGPTPGRFSVLLINPIGVGKSTLSGLPPGSPVTIVTSTAAAQGIANGTLRTDNRGSIIVPLPARSFVTIISQP